MSKVTMPEPDFTGLYVLDDEGFLVSAGHTPDQMQAYADARVREALEEILTISTDTRYISDIENKISEMLGVLT